MLDNLINEVCTTKHPYPDGRLMKEIQVTLGKIPHKDRGDASQQVREALTSRFPKALSHDGCQVWAYGFVSRRYRNAGVMGYWWYTSGIGPVVIKGAIDTSAPKVLGKPRSILDC